MNERHGKYWRILRYAVHYFSVAVGFLLRLIFGEDTSCVVRHIRVKGPHANKALSSSTETTESSVRIVFLSDFHASGKPRCPQALIEDAREKALAAKPDIIVLGGDYVDAPQDNVLLEMMKGTLFRPLCSCSNSNGDSSVVVAALGNHDQSRPWLRKQVIETLQDTGITVLDHSCLSLPQLGVKVVGVGDLSTRGDFKPEDLLLPAEHSVTGCQCCSTPVGREYDVERVIDLTTPSAVPSTDDTDQQQIFEKDDELMIVAVTHNPDAGEDLLLKYKCDIVLAGHTHGTQIWLPLVGPLLPWLKLHAWSWLQPAVRLLHGSNVKHWEWSVGLNKLWCHCGKREALLYVNSGIGHHPPCRIRCPPEVTVLDIIRQ